ncbi:caspase domain-containing protein [Vararia minispora EC-137]|uniref:Caspase domain-containing protein n=1 Tax=Vararia minispora EC-137 TaxID=1314806 RepID=A0ACB8Q518_9AGAM|nr:caspase domain-containing protein [Vararia minispora EC-137]
MVNRDVLIPKRRALLIGICYTGSIEVFDSSHKAVEDMRRLLIKHFDYQAEDIVVMMDAPHVEPELQPTKRNISREMRKLVKDAQPGDRFVFAFSGHSKQWQKKADAFQKEDAQTEERVDMFPEDNFKTEKEADTFPEEDEMDEGTSFLESLSSGRRPFLGHFCEYISECMTDGSLPSYKAVMTHMSHEMYGSWLARKIRQARLPGKFRTRSGAAVDFQTPEASTLSSFITLDLEELFRM